MARVAARRHERVAGGQYRLREVGTHAAARAGDEPNLPFGHRVFSGARSLVIGGGGRAPSCLGPEGLTRTMGVNPLELS
jgi:hypothetical protein